MTWRAVLLGLIGAVTICAITSYNDYVLCNTYVVGNQLPMGAICYFFLIALLINGPLSKWKPHQALTSGELAVAMGMVLVACCIPSGGLMRWLAPALIVPFWKARTNPDALNLLQSLGLEQYSRWLYPTFAGNSPRQWMNDPIVTGYAQRWTGSGPIPYVAWVRPYWVWGIFLAGLYGSILCIIALVRHQWYENERLAFPLAQIELGLIEQPRPGRWLNDILSQGWFWIAFGFAFFLRGWNGLHAYYPRYFEEIPTTFDMTTLFADPPWSYMLDWGGVKHLAIYLSVIGVSYFLQGSVSFSLWFFVLVMEASRMVQGTATGDPDLHGLGDQMFGAAVAYLGIIVWIGRRHWALVLRQAFRGERQGEAGGRYMSHTAAFWGLVGFFVLMNAWLCAVGCQLLGALVITVSLLTGFVLIARIVAETGLLQLDMTIDPNNPWQYMQLLGLARPSQAWVRTAYIASNMGMIFYDPRETFAVFASHSVKLADQTAFGGVERGGAAPDYRQERKLGRKLFILFGLTLVIAYTTGLFSMLWTEYHYATTAQPTAEMVNAWPDQWAVENRIISPTISYRDVNYKPPQNVWAHMAGGAALTLLLSALRLRFVWWPLHPVGYICMGMWPVRTFWLSIFFGWLIRGMVLRFGGAKLYNDLKPAMFGLIVGEAAVAGLFLVIGMVLNSMGIEYRPVMFMPD